MRKYPVVAEIPLLTLKNQSGSLNGVSMRQILNLSVCPSGLQIGIMRIFGPFSRPFFVPWEAISVTRKDRFFQKMAKISFAQSSISLMLPAEVADRLARASDGRWPETGSFPLEASHQTAARIFKQWLLLTCFASTFFTVVPRLTDMDLTTYPPIAITILFPAIVIGIASVVNYLMRPRN
jgi:hypothetical protein